MIVKEFDEVYSVYCTWFPSGIHYKSKYKISAQRAFMNKYVCVHESDDPATWQDVKDEINDRCIDNIRHGASIYIDPKCTMRRDLFRQSGYKIVLDKTKAEAIVLPSVSSLQQDSHSFNVWAVNADNELYLMTFKDDIKDAYRRSDIHDKLIEEGYKDVHFAIESDYDSDAYFIPKWQGYYDLLTEAFPDAQYIQEYDVPIQYPVSVDLEALKLWANIEDDNIRRQVLLASDIVKYPCTACMLLHNIWSGFDDSSNAIRGLFKEIGYYSCHSLTTDIFDKEEIQPDDWNLMQEFMMDRMGAPKDGGYIPEDRFYYTMTSFVLSRIAVKPMRIESPIYGDSLKEILRTKK